MRSAINYTTLVLIALIPMTPVTASDRPPDTADTPEIIARNRDVIVTLNAQQTRRRRSRPKRISNKYDVTTVTDGGTIEGVVIFAAAAPEPEKIQIVKDHETCDTRAKTRPRVTVDADGHLADAIVFLGNIKKGKAIPKPTAKSTIKQEHCTFVPHVQVIHTKEKFDVVNKDPVAHNAQCVQNMVTLFNPMQPKKGLRNEFSIKRPGLANVTCAVHNWMKAFVYVLPHPYHAVTAADGRFALTDVPPGDYDLVVWQEHLGEQTRRVHVDAGGTATVEFKLTPN